MRPCTPLVLSNEDLRLAMREFLTQLLPQCPDLPEEALARARAAIEHLLTPTPLPGHAWCHMDLTLHFATMANRPFWTPGRTPVHSTHWVGQRNLGIQSMEGLGIMLHARDHFSVVDQHISEASMTEACRILELALAGETLPATWTCVQGTAQSDPTATPFPIDRPPELNESVTTPTEALSCLALPLTPRPLRFYPVMHLLAPPPRTELSAKKRSATMAARSLFLHRSPLQSH